MLPSHSNKDYTNNSELWVFKYCIFTVYKGRIVKPHTNKILAAKHFKIKNDIPVQPICRKEENRMYLINPQRK